MSSSARITTPVGRLSYVHIFKPRAYQEGHDPKYSCSIIFNKSDEALLAPIRAAFNQVLQEDFEGTLPYGASGAEYLMDGAVRYPGDAYYADKLILNTSQQAERPPQVVQVIEGQPVPQAVTLPSDVYSGCEGKLLINFYGFQGGKKGIACSLQAVCKTADGESLGGTGITTEEAANAFVNNGAPAPVSAAPAPATGVVTKTMTAAAAGVTYEDYIAAGWTEQQLIDNGLLVA